MHVLLLPLAALAPAGSRLVKHGVFTVPTSTAMPACASEPQDRCSSNKPAAAAAAPAQQQQRGMTVRPEAYYVQDNGTFLQLPCCKPRFPVGAQRIKRVLTYGDSTTRNNWDTWMFAAYTPCKPKWQPWLLYECFTHLCKPVESSAEVDAAMDAVVRRCSGGLPMSAVPMGTNTMDVHRYAYKDAILFNMSAWAYNASRLAAHKPPMPRPPPEREFSLVYVDGWGSRDINTVEQSLAHLRAGDILFFNVVSA